LLYKLNKTYPSKTIKRFIYKKILYLIFLIATFMSHYITYFLFSMNICLYIGLKNSVNYLSNKIIIVITLIVYFTIILILYKIKYYKDFDIVIFE
jgi:hypothetical protein